MSVTRKESIELECTYAALVRIRTLARELLDGAVSHEPAQKIIELTDVFHEVPAEIARGRELDPCLFYSLVTKAGMSVPEDYPAA